VILRFLLRRSWFSIIFFFTSCSSLFFFVYWVIECIIRKELGNGEESLPWGKRIVFCRYIVLPCVCISQAVSNRIIPYSSAEVLVVLLLHYNVNEVYSSTSLRLRGYSDKRESNHTDSMCSDICLHVFIYPPCPAQIATCMQTMSLQTLEAPMK
jgi:hypothetical protein